MNTILLTIEVSTIVGIIVFLIMERTETLRRFKAIKETITELDNHTALAFDKADMIGKTIGNSKIVEKVRVLDLTLHQIDIDNLNKIDALEKRVNAWYEMTPRERRWIDEFEKRLTMIEKKDSKGNEEIENRIDSIADRLHNLQMVEECPYNEKLHYHHDGCPACHEIYKKNKEPLTFEPVDE